MVIGVVVAGSAVLVAGRVVFVAGSVVFVAGSAVVVVTGYVRSSSSGNPFGPASSSARFVRSRGNVVVAVSLKAVVVTANTFGEDSQLAELVIAVASSRASVGFVFTVKGIENVGGIRRHRKVRLQHRWNSSSPGISSSASVEFVVTGNFVVSIGGIRRHREFRRRSS